MKHSNYTNIFDPLTADAADRLPISSVCNGRCIFCSNKLSPYSIRREGFRPLADIKKAVNRIDPGVQSINLSDSWRGRITQGEAMLHPDIIEILRLIRKRSKTAVILVTTNGTLLTESFIKKLLPFRPMNFMISYHSCDPANWCRIVGLGENEFRTARDSFFLLAKNMFNINATIVPLPKLVGYDDIENTIRELRYFLKDISILPAAYSDNTPSKLKSLFNTDPKELAGFFNKMRAKYRICLHYPGDPLSAIPFYPDAIINEISQKGFRKAAWLFSEAAYPKADTILRRCARATDSEHTGFLVKNMTYGGNINAAGLLMVEDFRKTVKNITAKNKKEPFDLFLLPSIAFSKFGEDLMLKNYSTLETEFKTRFLAR